MASHSSESIFAQLAERGIPLPTSVQSQGAYALLAIHGGVASVSGQLPRLDSAGAILSGRVSKDGDLAEARRAAQLCLARALLALHQELGDLAQVERLLHLRGFINAAPDFEHHGAVMDAASELARDLFGDAGRHARSALGVSSLPSAGLVELEVTAALRTPH